MNVAFVSAAAALGLYLSRGPWIAYREQGAKADAASHDMLRAESEKKELLVQQAKVESALGQEQQARSQGYLKPGEEPLKLSGADKPTD